MNTHAPTPDVQAEIMDRLSGPSIFRMWIHQHASRPGLTGKYAYCEGSGFGFNPTGHYVPFGRIKAGYQGHNVCGDCQQEHYPEPTALEEAQERTQADWDRLQERARGE